MMASTTMSFKLKEPSELQTLKLAVRQAFISRHGHLSTDTSHICACACMGTNKTFNITSYCRPVVLGNGSDSCRRSVQTHNLHLIPRVVLVINQWFGYNQANVIQDATKKNRERNTGLKSWLPTTADWSLIDF